MPNTYTQLFIQIVFAVKGQAIAYTQKAQGNFAEIHDCSYTK